MTPLIGTKFLPRLEEGAIAINVVRLPNASLEGSVETGTFMEKQLRSFSEVKSVVSKTGRAEISEDPMGPEQNDVLIMLHPESEWTTGRTKAELVEAMQKRLPFALVGEILSMVLLGITLNVPSTVGFIALFGVSATGTA